MPSCLFGDLAHERIQQILARLNMASDDVPAAREQPSLPTASMYEHTAIAIEDQPSPEHALHILGAGLTNRVDVACLTIQPGQDVTELFWSDVPNQLS